MENKNSHLSLGGLFIALHLIFVFVAKFFVGSELILVLFLPLLSAIYALKFNKKAVTMFFIATFFLCLIFDPVSTFIYVLPSLICGTVYGFLKKNKFKELSVIYISSLSHAVCVLISFSAIALMFKEIDFSVIFSWLSNKQGEELFACVYLFFVLLGLLEAFLTHIITNDELKKMGYNEIVSEDSTPGWMIIGLFISVLAYVFLSCIKPIFSIYAFPFVLAFAIPHIIEFIIKNKYKWAYLLLGVMCVTSLFLLSIFNPIFYPILGLLVFSPLIFINIFGVLYTNSSKYSNNGQNKIE